MSWTLAEYWGLGYEIYDKETLSRVESLVINSQSMTHMIPALFTLNNLKVLDLSKNLIQCIPQSIGLLHSLTNLDLSDNFINVIPDEIGQLHSLKYFNVGNNLISHIPDVCVYLANLRMFLWGGNPIEYIPENFWHRRLQNYIRCDLSPLTTDELRIRLKDYDVTQIPDLCIYFAKISSLKYIVKILLEIYSVNVILQGILATRSTLSNGSKQCTDVLISLIHTSKLDPRLISHEQFEKKAYNKELHSILKKYRK